MSAKIYKKSEIGVYDKNTNQGLLGLTQNYGKSDSNLKSESFLEMNNFCEFVNNLIIVEL